jgi:hypothetical protein
MAADYTSNQQDTIRKLQNYCATILDSIAAAKQLRQEAIDKGYTPGTATTGITDAITATVAPSCIAADLTAALATIATLDTTLAASSRAAYITLEKLRP